MQKTCLKLALSKVERVRDFRGDAAPDTSPTAKARRAVLGCVLSLHPERHLKVPALVGLLVHPLNLDQGSELECAVRDLVSEGLLYCRFGEVWPARASVGGGARDG